MGMSAVRGGDACNCFAHADGGAIAAPPPRTVRVNGRPVVVQSDTCGCRAGPAVVSVGSGTVQVNSLAPARVGEMSVRGGHAGTFTVGSPNVRIGGPAIVGPFARFKRACAQLADGRRAGRLLHQVTREQWNAAGPDLQKLYSTPTPSGNAYQSAGNCGLESVRQIIRERTGKDLDESELFERAYDYRDPSSDEYRHRGLTGDPANPSLTFSGKRYGDVWKTAGGTRPDQDKKLLELYGVEAENIACTRPNIENSLAQGQPIVAPVDFSFRDGGEHRGSHAILVFAMELDDDGNVAAFYINDTADGGGCGTRVPAERFTNSLQTNKRLTRPSSGFW